MKLFLRIRKISAPLAILFINFTCLGLAFTNGQSRGVINLDYLFSFFFLNKRIAFVVYASLISIVDFFIILSKSYNFNPMSFLENWEMLGMFNYNSNYVLLIQCLFFLIAIILINRYVFIFASGSLINNKTIGVVALAGTLLLDVLVGSFYTNGLERKSIVSNNYNINPSTSGIASLITETNTRYFSGNSKVKIKTVESALYDSLSRPEQEAYPRKIVLIVMESYGLFNEGSINDKLVDELRENLNGSYQIKFNSIKFNGATTSGEVRELCGVRGDYHDVHSIADEQECLPRKLLKQDYDTSGFHYYYESAFNRGIWWPKVGLVNLHFLDSYARSGNRKLCGGFLNGGCDKHLISDLFESIDNESKAFSYALTLNSHLPVYRNQDIADIEKIELKYLGETSASVKLLINSWRVVLREVAEQMNKRSHDDMMVVIVGDHAPPYLNMQDRSIFSKTNVPYIVLSTINDYGHKMKINQ